MKSYKIAQITMFLTVVGVVLFPVSVLALDLGIGSGGIAGDAADNAGYNVAGTTETTLASTAGLIIQGIFGFLAIVFTLLMVFAGFQWMTGRGDEERVRKAQGTIRMAVIGVIIVLASYSISIFILDAILSVPGPQQPTQ